MTSARFTNERAMKLMAYADGELEGAELAEVEQWLREDAESAMFTNDLATLGAFVKEGHAPPAVDLTDAIMAKIEAPAAAVVPIKAAGVAKAKKRSTVAWVVAGLALAASIFLVTRKKEEAPLAQSTSPLVQPASPTAAANVSTASTASVDVENPGSSVSVFYLPSENAASTTTHVVVWVDESGGK